MSSVSFTNPNSWLAVSKSRESVLKATQRPFSHLYLSQRGTIGQLVNWVSSDVKERKAETERERREVITSSVGRTVTEKKMTFIEIGCLPNTLCDNNKRKCDVKSDGSISMWIRIEDWRRGTLQSSTAGMAEVRKAGLDRWHGIKRAEQGSKIQKRKKRKQRITDGSVRVYSGECNQH